MTTISLFANDQLLTVVSKPKIASGDMNSVLLHVDFDPIWDRFAKSAVFFTSNNDTVYEMILNDGECTVPHEVLEESGTLFIGVRGVDSDNDAIKTSTLVKYKVEDGAPVGDGTSVDPTPDVYQQMIAMFNNHIANKDNPHGTTADQLGATSVALLWENASPTSAFAPQTIALDLSAYDSVCITARRGTGDGDSYINPSTTVNIGENGELITVNIGSVGGFYLMICVRYFTVTENGITFGSVDYGREVGYTGDRLDLVIPVRIYGIRGVIV